MLTKRAEEKVLREARSCCDGGGIESDGTARSTTRSISVRGAAERDLEAVRDLLRQVDLPLDGLEDQFVSGFGVAEAEGSVVGAAGIERHGCYGLLRSVVVDPRLQGRQVGERLVTNRLAWAEAEGLESVYLLTTTAERYFPRFGFEAVDRTAVPEEIRASSEFAVVCPASARAMKLAPGARPGGLKARIRARYGAAASAAMKGQAAGCGGGDAAQACCDPITSNLYDTCAQASAPQEALQTSLGCGNPTALAHLAAGEVVLDLGSGGGLDVILSAKRVGPTGRVFGLDMTDEMLELARANQRRAGIANAEFLKGEMEQIPLPADSIDVIISNCVLNLSVDKPRALAEAFRVLKPGGRLAISDIVVRKPLPEDLRRNAELWMGCIAGALEEGEYGSLLRGAGFEEIEIEPTRIFGAEDARSILDSVASNCDDAESLDGTFMSAFVRARKPKVEW